MEGLRSSGRVDVISGEKGISDEAGSDDKCASRRALEEQEIRFSKTEVRTMNIKTNCKCCSSELYTFIDSLFVA